MRKQSRRDTANKCIIYLYMSFVSQHLSGFQQSFYKLLQRSLRLVQSFLVFYYFFPTKNNTKNQSKSSSISFNKTKRRTSMLSHHTLLFLFKSSEKETFNSKFKQNQPAAALWWPACCAGTLYDLHKTLFYLILLCKASILSYLCAGSVGYSSEQCVCAQTGHVSLSHSYCMRVASRRHIITMRCSIWDASPPTVKKQYYYI